MRVRERMRFELSPGKCFPNPPPRQPHQSAAGSVLLKGNILQSDRFFCCDFKRPIWWYLLGLRLKDTVYQGNYFL